MARRGRATLTSSPRFKARQGLKRSSVTGARASQVETNPKIFRRQNDVVELCKAFNFPRMTPSECAWLTIDELREELPWRERRLQECIHEACRMSIVHREDGGIVWPYGVVRFMQKNGISAGSLKRWASR